MNLKERKINELKTKLARISQKSKSGETSRSLVDNLIDQGVEISPAQISQIIKIYMVGERIDDGIFTRQENGEYGFHSIRPDDENAEVQNEEWFKKITQAG